MTRTAPVRQGASGRAPAWRRGRRLPALVGRRLALPWGQMQAWQGGRGPMLLALHGLGGSGRYWEGLARLVEDRFTVVAPDHAGFGHSDMPTLAYSRAFHLDNIDALLADLADDRPVVVVGHSLGGVLAALWAARHPERVAGLALVATPYPATDRGMPAADRRLREKDEAPRRQKMYCTFQSLWPVISWPVRSRTFPRAVIADYMRHSLGSYWGTAEAVLWDPETEAELAGLAELHGTPALILSASDDRHVRYEDAGRWIALLPAAERRIVTGGHQLLLRTHFEELTRWLGTLPAAVDERRIA